jgi:predicted HTH domain antitoxin
MGTIDSQSQRAENQVMTATLDITLPPSVHLTESELKMILAAKLFDLGELSSGQSAKMVGLSRREFLESVGKYGVSIFQYDTDELEEDLVRLRSEATR